MATIPMGNFGNTVAQPQRATSANPDALGAAQGRVLAQSAQAMQQDALQQMADQARQEQLALEEKRSNDALDAIFTHEAELKTKADRLIDVLQTGQLDPQAAREMLTDESDRIYEETVGKLPPSKFAQAALRHAGEIKLRVGLQVENAARSGERQRFGAQATSVLDSLGKLAGLPGESLDVVFAKADMAYPELAARAGVLPERSAKTLQDWKDNARFQRARMDLVAARRDPQAIDDFIKRLESGDLSNTLDPDRRAILIKEAESNSWQIKQSQEHAIEKREKVAERAVAASIRQIESAIPIDAEGWQDLRAKVEGTSYAGEFNALVSQEREVQQVLRMPVGQQEAFVQQREAKLMQEGGTMVDRANLQRIKATIETNKKELEQAPLLAAQRLFGRKIEPLNLGDLLAPGGTHRAAAVFADRTATLQAMSRQFGTRVGQRPLLPQEKDALLAGLDVAAPSEAVALFGAMRAAIDDDASYRAAMQQIAPDSPVKARAGILAAAGRHVTLQDNLISDDVRVPSTKIAQTMLVGESILAKSKKQKAEDGQARTLFAPPLEAFAKSFGEVVGDLYRGRPGAQEQDLQAAYAYYVGRTSELGKTTDGTVDSTLAKEATTATLGAVVNVNGQGRARAPLGMSEDDFKDKVREQFAQEVRRRNLPASMLNEWPHYGLQDYRRDGTYVLTVGGQPVVDPSTRATVVIDLDPPPPSGLRFRSAADLIPKSSVTSSSQGGAKK